jgi:hypothetical protein
MDINKKLKEIYLGKAFVGELVSYHGSMCSIVGIDGDCVELKYVGFDARHEPTFSVKYWAFR